MSVGQETAFFILSQGTFRIPLQGAFYSICMPIETCFQQAFIYTDRDYGSFVKPFDE
ncbi:hypothetical protein HMPREF1555_01827 [Porphyromonas gingivalis F0570]|uniref:Uncharacterized protein n=1 Tax=Porphyromonas gingivalis F0570 TaxID=1227271 RepID=A0A0E2LNP2_PORGN|nr:hypothetical protein HMPREF1555_01827 [Porphyromonas gingivalis F0570]